MYGVWLNLMRGKAEEVRLVGVADTKEELLIWIKSQQCEPYRDDQWLKSFIKGSRLEWYNDVIDYDVQGVFGEGIKPIMTRQEYMEDHGKYYDSLIEKNRIENA